MTQQATGTAVVSAGGQMPATTKKIDVLKKYAQCTFCSRTV